MNKLKLFELFDKAGSFITEIGYMKHYKPKKGDIIIDAGSYFGQFAIKIAREVGPKGKVISFEPDARNCAVQKKKIAESGLKNIILINRALLDKKKKMPFKSMFQSSYIKLDDFTESSHLNKTKGPTVDCTTLDAEIKKLKLKKIDFIKMDIEGAELEAFKGAKKSLAMTKNMAIACYHVRNGTTTGKTLTPIFEKLGFTTSIGFPIHPTLYAIR